MSLEREEEHRPGLGPCLVCFPGAPPPPSAASTSSSSQQVNRSSSTSTRVRFDGLPPLPCLPRSLRPARPLTLLIKISISWSIAATSRVCTSSTILVLVPLFDPENHSNLQRFYYVAVMNDAGQAVTSVKCEKKKFIFEVFFTNKKPVSTSTRHSLHAIDPASLVCVGCVEIRSCCVETWASSRENSRETTKKNVT